MTTLGSMGHNVDGTVRSIKREYDDIGRLEKISSRDDNATVLNQIQHEYGDIGKVTTAWQEHSGEVTTDGGGESLKVVYEYDLDASSGIFEDGTRLKSVTYPDGRKVQYDFDTSDSFYDRLNRPRAIEVTYPGGASLEEIVDYRYNGVRRVVSAEYRPGATDPDVKLDYYQGTSGEYAGFDRFGRVVDQYWDDPNSSTDPDRFKYGHDYAGNREWREDVIAEDNSKDFDHYYTYDGLHRLTESDRGDLTGNPPTGVTSSNLLLEWALDETGNWTDFKVTVLTLVLDQDRTHTKANEIDDIYNITGNEWIDPDYDEAGNMTEGPDPGDGEKKQQYKYDAWNRLVEVLDDQNATVATYAYDGLNRRIEKVDKTGMSDVTYDYYYNQDWQALEVRKDSATDPVEQYVWHLHYIDALAFRLWDKDEDGDFEDPNDVQYFTFDANFNVTALLDDSGTVKERYGYTPYGTLSVRDANFESRSSSNFANPYTYTGRRYDPETKLYYYRNRYYHPLLGRFGTRDPIGYSYGSPNLYEFVHGAPTVYTDPSGRIAVCCRELHKGGFCGILFDHCQLRNECMPNERSSPVWVDRDPNRMMDDGKPCSKVTNADVESCIRRNPHKDTPYAGDSWIGNNCQTGTLLRLGKCCLSSTWQPQFIAGNPKGRCLNWITYELGTTIIRECLEWEVPDWRENCAQECDDPPRCPPIDDISHGGWPKDELPLDDYPLGDTLPPLP